MQSARNYSKRCEQPFKPKQTPPLIRPEQLKPPCIAVSKFILTSKPNRRELTAALGSLHTALQRIPHEKLDAKLGDYVFFPLSHVFRQYQQLNDRAVELALLCLDMLVCSCWRVQIAPEMAKQLLILVTFVVGGRPGAAAEDAARSEETKLAGCRCLLDLFSSLERGGETLLDEVDTMPAAGHTVTTLLGAFEKGEMLQLQVVSLQALEKLLLHAVRDEDTRASFYPGVVSGIIKALGMGKTTKRSYTVLKDMVRLLERLIATVLDDRHIPKLPESDAVEKGEETLKLTRSRPWMKATAANTKVALEQVLKLRTHPKVEVRTAVFELARGLLENCAQSMDEATTILVETLVVISGDADEALARLAENTVRVMAMMGDKVKDAVRGCLDRWIGALPKVMAGSDEDAKQRVITRLSTAFGLCTELEMESDLLRDMLADGIKESLLAANASTRPETSLVRATPVQPRLEMLLVDRSNSTEGSQVAKFPDIMAQQRSQTGTMDSMKQLLASLGQSASGLQLAQRHLRDASLPGLPPASRATSLWISLSLLRGSLSADTELSLYLDYDLLEPSPLQRHVLDELLSLSLTSLTTSVESPSESEENAPLHCLALESLSLIAETHKRHFRTELVDALYPVVHHLGSESAEVQQHAIVALNNIAHSCEYGSAKALLLDNVDYMVNAVSLKLNIFDLSPQAPVVLNMLLKLVGPKLVPYLDDLVVSIFSILDGFHEYERLCEELFMVLGVIVEESSKGADEEAKRIEGGAKNATARSRKIRRPLKDDELIQFFKNSRDENRPRLDPLPEPEDEEDEGDEGEEGEDPKAGHPRKPWGKPKAEPTLPLNEEDEEERPPPNPEEEPPKPSKTYEIVQRITRLSQHYLTHGSMHMRAKVLSLVSNATHTLAVNESEYLPRHKRHLARCLLTAV